MQEPPKPVLAPPPIPTSPDVETHIWKFAGLPADVADVRNRLVDQLSSHEWPEEDVERAKLLISELASNAVTHGQSAFTVTAWIDGIASIAVHDADIGDGDPHVVDGHPHLVGGRGLRLVATLANQWGVHHQSNGKAVWFEYDPTSRR